MKLAIPITVALAVFCSGRNIGKEPSFGHSFKIIGGEEADPHSHPYQAGVYSDDSLICGGTILSADTVLTSGYCCQDLHNGKVVGGEHDLTRDEGTEQWRQVKDVIVHPRFRIDDFFTYIQIPFWDVCILKLEETFELNEYVSAATLPTPNQEFSGEATVSGWGTLAYNGDMADKLQVVSIPVVDIYTCLFEYGSVLDTQCMFCAGDAGKGSCQYDAGGPLMCGDILCGIASWGYKCGLVGYPGVYSDLGKLLDFIKENI